LSGSPSLFFSYDTTAAFYTYNWDLCMFGMFVLFSISMASFDHLVGDCVDSITVLRLSRVVESWLFRRSHVRHRFMTERYDLCCWPLSFAYHWCTTDTVEVNWRLCVFGYLALFLHGQVTLEDMLPHFLVRFILLGPHAGIQCRMNHASSVREVELEFRVRSSATPLEVIWACTFCSCRSELSHIILLCAEACWVF